MADTSYPYITFREAGVSLIDCDHRTPPAALYGRPYVAIPQVKNGRIDLAGVRYISDEHFKEWTRKANPQPYDVVLSRRCNPGETAFVSPGLKFALGQNLVLLRADGKKVLPEYLRWLTQGPIWWAQISKFMNVGAVFDSLKCADVPKFELPIPSLEEQKAISSVLAALDNKIELSRRMNVTLEAMARALFKSWFIDFDPVRAKMEGKQLFGMDAATATLFPSWMVSSELGETPEGWEVPRFSSLFQVIGGGTPKTSNTEYWNGDIPWFSIADAPSDTDVFVLKTEKTITQKGLDESSTKILPPGTTIITARGTVGRLALVGHPMAMNQSCYGLSPLNGITPGFLYFSTRKAIAELQSRAHGSVFDTITTKTFDGLNTIRPPDAVVSAYESIAWPMLEKIKANLIEISELEKNRNYLLPKLISGDIRIPDAEKFVEGSL